MRGRYDSSYRSPRGFFGRLGVQERTTNIIRVWIGWSDLFLISIFEGRMVVAPDEHERTGDIEDGNG